MEKTIFLDSQNIMIEGKLCLQGLERGIVMTHPHPLYGGDMNNPVVQQLIRCCKDKGYSTLRFNFRGVGQSQGRYDHGNGEQEDVLSAIHFLESQGIQDVWLAGYSFGTWVNTKLVTNHRLNHSMIMVSPPVAFMDFRPIHSLVGLKLVIVGEVDDIAPVAQVKSIQSQWNQHAHLEIIQGADHFFSNTLHLYQNVLQKHLSLQ
ncbi:MAG: alpha/beta hydrolase [Desulfobacterales bacterium]|nr:alpha/beta hydrolase [Desulfobacterales bacterium]